MTAPANPPPLHCPLCKAEAVPRKVCGGMFNLYCPACGVPFVLWVRDEILLDWGK